jgi:hypothetical protein
LVALGKEEMMKAMSGPKILIVHPSSNKFGKGAASMSGRSFWLVVLLAVFGSVSLLTVFSTARAPSSGTAPPRVTFTVGADAASAGATGGALPAHVFDALVRYAAAAGANSTASMPEEDVRAIASVLRRRAPCNLMVFGLGAETPLWRALNHGGRTVFLDENQWYVSHLEGRHPGLEAYDVAYTTTVREFPDLLEAARAARAAECRPVQNLLFSDCRLAINDLPNHLYDVAWDVILVDGPRGSVLLPSALPLHHIQDPFFSPWQSDFLPELAEGG